MDFWCRKRQLCPLSHNHCPDMLTSDFIFTLFFYSTGPPSQAGGSFSPGGPSGLAPGGGSGSGGPGSTCGGSPAGAPRPRFDEDVNLPLIKVVVLGAPGVGKTSIVKVLRHLGFCSQSHKGSLIVNCRYCLLWPILLRFYYRKL